MVKFKNVLSLFDGHSGGQIALNVQGIEYENYYASEIDKYAMQATKAIYPNTVQLGNIIKLRRYLEKPELYERMLNCSFVKQKNKDLILVCLDLLVDGVDLLMGGSPCQGFSFSGKQLNFNDPRSKLFFEFVKIKNILKPKYFLLENVRMKKEYYDTISEYIGVEAIKDEKGKPYINSALVSAQNRVRSYWTNIEDVQQPEDKGILLKDILEECVDEKYIIKNPNNGFNGLDIFKKGKTLRIGGMCSQTNKHNYDLIKISKSGVIKKNQEKAGCLTGGGHSGGNHSDMDLLCIALRGRYNKDDSISQNLEARKDDKTNSLTTVQKDNLIFLGGVNGKKWLNDGKEFSRNYSQGSRMYSIEGKSSIINSNGGGYGRNIGLYLDNYVIRRLTPRECGRLQTVPEEIIDIMLSCGISNSQLYKMFGNGFNIDTIAHILSYIK